MNFEYIKSPFSDTLLHIVVRGHSAIPGRANIVQPDQFLQVALMNMPKGTTFKPHKHKWKNGVDKVIPQEAWLVVRGKVKAFYYGLDDKLLAVVTLEPGDCGITIAGGHNYEILEENTIVYEIKTGPYKDQETDKEMIRV